MSMHQKFVQLDNLQIQYLQAGQGQPVLIIPGFMMPAKGYQRLANIYTHHGYKVYILTMPGVSPSDKLPAKWQFDDYAHLVIRFIERQDLHRLKLVGHSMGGGIASLVAVDRPDRLDRLILFDSTGIHIPRTFWGWVCSRIKDLDTAVVPKFLAHLIWHYFGSYRRAFAMIRNLDLEQTFKRIQVPTHIYWGEYDQTIPISYGRQIASLISNSKFVIMEEQTHDWPVTNPQIYDRKIQTSQNK